MKQENENYTNKLVSDNLGLVYMIVRKLFPYDKYNDDLIQEGCVALCNAARMFNSKSDTLFSTYASCSIIHAVKRAHYRELNNNLNAIPAYSSELLTRLYNQAPGEYFYNCEEKTENSLSRDKIVNDIKQILTKKEFIVVCLYFGLTDTQEQMSAYEIGFYFNVGDERIRQILRASLKKLRLYLNR